MAQIIQPPFDPTTLKINTVRNGMGSPSNSIGIDGDFYIDKSLFNIYGPKANGQWPSDYASMIGPSSAIQRTSPQIVTQTGAQTITLPISNPNYVAVFYNGQLLSENDYARNGATISISSGFGASVNSRFQVEYASPTSAGSSGSTLVPVQEYVTGTFNGTNKQFSVSHTPATNTLRLFLNGALVDFANYSLSGANITLDKAPAATTSSLIALYSY